MFCVQDALGTVRESLEAHRPGRQADVQACGQGKGQDAQVDAAHEAEAQGAEVS